MHLHRPRILTILMLLCVVVSTTAQESFFTRMLNSSSPRVAIYSNWDSLIAMKDNSSWDARVRINLKDSTTEWKAQLTVRGKFRRMRCEFPPLEINLKKGALRRGGLLEFDKLKLVTHCNESPDASDLYEELLVYQLYGLLTPFSFRACPLRVDYLHLNGKSYQRNKSALILEPTAELAHRLNGIEKEGFGVGPDSLDAASYCRVALFQFMIGNFDWDQTQQRNVKMIGNAGSYHVVPYDFDFSAIVYPAYARLPAHLGISDFRDRVYLGTYFDEHLPETIQEFLDNKSTLLDHVKNYPHLPSNRRREIMSYLEQFFDFLESQGQEIKNGTILPYVSGSGN